MQVYRELAVLTARPSPDGDAARPAPSLRHGSRRRGLFGRPLARRCGARHRARRKPRGRVPIFVGGTGLYFKALTEGLAAVPDVPPEIREHWRERAETHRRGRAPSRACTRAIPSWRQGFAPSDPQRIVRALEVIDATSVSLAEWQGAAAAPVLAAGGRAEARHRARARAALCGDRCALRPHDRGRAPSRRCGRCLRSASIPASRRCGRMACASLPLISPAQAASKTAVAKAKTETPPLCQAADDLAHAAS